MASVKKAKCAKCTKCTKEPKKVVKEPTSREIKNLAKQAKKADKLLNKNIDRKLSVAAVLLCLLVAILDTVDKKAGK